MKKKNGNGKREKGKGDVAWNSLQKGIKGHSFALYFNLFKKDCPFFPILREFQATSPFPLFLF